MPFLFVDYDQGAGGEYFCENLSKSPQCVPLTAQRTNTNRTKVNDVFEQEFLKAVSIPKIIESGELYDVVPCHRKTEYASTILKNVRGIRIANPKDSSLRDFLNYNRVIKVLRATLPSDKHFIGEVEELLRSSESKDWVKQIKSSMTNAELLLLSKGIPATEENVEHLISTFLAQEYSEPEYNYDLIIPYEDLFFNIENIKKRIKDVFNIDVVGDWLSTYLINYNAYLAKT